MATLLELAAEIVKAHASTTPMSKEELIAELASVHDALKAMDSGETPAGVVAADEPTGDEPAVTKRKAFGKDKIICMICGQGMKTLVRHLRTSHDMTPAEYREKFDIPKGQALAAKNYSEKRRQMAIERGLGEKLVAARVAKRNKKK